VIFVKDITKFAENLKRHPHETARRKLTYILGITVLIPKGTENVESAYLNDQGKTLYAKGNAANRIHGSL
jgi:hypothetical protein